MAICANCGAELPPRFRFCGTCGAPLGDAPEPQVRKVVTVLFTDLVESTPLGEQLDAETYRRVISRYFTEVSRVLERHGGTVEKFIGDAVMAVFGIPTLHEEDALRAVRAAGELREALRALNDELRRDYGIQLVARTGINTGEVVAGDTDGGQAFATGEAVAVAQRLEAAARQGEILLGDSTYRLVRDAVLVEPLDPLSLKGKSTPVSAWRLLSVLSGAPGLARRFDAPMVGRKKELELLRATFDETVRGQACRLVTVVGSAGIGKSRLANELLASVKGEASALVGHCLAYGEGITYWPLREIVREAGGELTSAGLEQLLSGAEEAGRIASRVAGAIGLGEHSGPPEETAWAVRRFLEHLAGQRPLIVGFEDLQWAEPVCLDLIEYLVGWSRGAPILILCLARPDILERHPGWLRAGANATSITLEPLSQQESETLLELLRGKQRLDRDLTAQITQTAEGNPLFVEQMLAMLSEDGLATTGSSIPPSIHALVAARLDRLEPHQRAVIERAAVIGNEFSRGAVAELSSMAEREFVSASLMRLARREFIDPGRSMFPHEDGYRFRHTLIRDAAYLEIPKRLRSELHEKYADWLEHVAAKRLGEFEEIIGYHLEQAFRYHKELGAIGRDASALAVRAGERLAAAGRRAMASRGDARSGTNLLSRAAALLPRNHPERSTVLSELGSALMITGDFKRAEGVLDEALEGASAAGDARLEARVRIELGFHGIFAGAEEASQTIPDVTARTMSVLSDAGDHLGLSRAWRLKSEVAVAAGQWEARADALERALDYARLAGDVREEATLLGLLAHALYFGPIPVEQAVPRCERYLSAVSGDRSAEAAISGVLAGLLAMRGEFDQARELWAAACAELEELGLNFRRAARSVIPAAIETLAGNDEAAERELRCGYETLEAMGEKGVRAAVAALLAESICRQGRDDEAAVFAERAQALAAADDLVPQVLWRSVRAKVLARSGELDQAQQLAREAAARVDATDFLDLKAATFLSLAEVLDAGEETEEAERLKRQAHTLYDRKGNVAAASQLVVT